MTRHHDSPPEPRRRTTPTGVTQADGMGLDYLMGLVREATGPASPSTEQVDGVLRVETPRPAAPQRAGQGKHIVAPPPRRPCACTV